MSNCPIVSSDFAPWSNADVFIAITGANRGFGRAILFQFIKVLCAKERAQMAASLHITLIGRNVAALKETAALAIKKEIEMKCDVGNFFKVEVCPASVDLTTASEAELTASLSPLFAAVESRNTATPSRPSLAILVHNAGSLGDIDKLADGHNSVSRLQDYFSANLSSLISLTSLFLQRVVPTPPTEASAVSALVINVSSLCAVQPLTSLSQYCVGKAARDMYLRCLSQDRCDVAALNYAPGPLATDMFDKLTTDLGDTATRDNMVAMKTDGKLVDPEASAAACVRLLHCLHFETSPDGRRIPESCASVHIKADLTDLWKGKHVDYFDLEFAD